uniref:Uncharacterized protein n=1 Tax=Nannospalax galili TaxID=1026970 RepID=A0A8C6RYN5_NANGA
MDSLLLGTCIASHGSQHAQCLSRKQHAVGLADL